MPEVNVDATFLIATSWQALKRAKSGNERTIECNCTVVILFAGLFIEANLSHIIDKMGRTADMISFLGGYSYPGLMSKMGWFYNDYIARDKANSKREMYQRGIESKVYRKFPGFYKLYNFRNAVSHGVIKRNYTNLSTAKELRIQAKDIVEKLFEISNSAGFEIPRVVTYDMALLENDYP